MSTFATLLVVPSIFAVVVGNRASRSPSIYPGDPHSTHYDPSVDPRHAVPTLQEAAGPGLSFDVHLTLEQETAPEPASVLPPGLRQDEPESDLPSPTFQPVPAPLASERDIEASEPVVAGPAENPYPPDPVT